MKKQETKSLNSKNQPKKTTKEKIFDSSVDLFSKKGFNEVSVREIAKQAGIREGSIYNHYKNKEAILDAIIDHFKSEITQNNFPEEEWVDLMDLGAEKFFLNGAEMFMERINIPQMEKIWRLVLIETYHNEKIREFFKKEVLEAPLAVWENIFSIMIEKKMIKPINPQTMAYEYWSFAIFLIFEYFIIKYDENQPSMSIGLEKMIEHTKFLLNSIKID